MPALMLNRSSRVIPGLPRDVRFTDIGFIIDTDSSYGECQQG